MSKIYTLGCPVIAKGSMKKISKTENVEDNVTIDARKWEPIKQKEFKAVYIGYRYLKNTEVMYEDFNLIDTKYKESIKVALVVVSELKDPIYVGFEDLKPNIKI